MAEGEFDQDPSDNDEGAESVAADAAAAAEAPAVERARLEKISSLSWEHPADAAALNSMRQVPGFDAAMRRLFALIAERSLRVMVQGSSIEVTAQQYAHINTIYEEVLWALDAPERYPLFLSRDGQLSTGAAGMSQPLIVLSSGAVMMMDDEQLRFNLGRQVGHILSEHVMYKTMLQLMVQLSRLAFVNVMSGMAYTAIVGALMEWDRKSELSSDRAGLLAMQDPDGVRRALMRSASSLRKGVSLEAFREQARRYEEEMSNLDGLARTMALLNRRHNFPVQRIAEIDDWIEAGAYDRIIGGEYLRRDEEPLSRSRRPLDLWRASYGEGLKDSPIGNIFRSIRDRFGPSPGDDDGAAEDKPRYRTAAMDGFGDEEE